MKKFIPLILAIALMVGVFIYTSSTKNQYKSKVFDQQTQISALEMELSVLQNAKMKNEYEIVHDATGADSARVQADHEAVEEMMALVCTWDSHSKYTSARNTVMRRYNVAEDSQFMETFMPDVPSKESNDGTAYNRIDTNGLRMEYEDLKPIVTKVVADKYSYVATVTTSTTWDNGGEAEVEAVMTYTVDADGAISDLYAVPLS